MTITVQTADLIICASNIWVATAASDTFWLAQGTANKRSPRSGIYSSFDDFTASINGTVYLDYNGISATGVIPAIGNAFGKFWARSRAAWAHRRSPSVA